MDIVNTGQFLQIGTAVLLYIQASKDISLGTAMWQIL